MIVNFIPFFKRKNFDDGVKEPDEVKHFTSFSKYDDYLNCYRTSMKWWHKPEQAKFHIASDEITKICLLYTSPSPRDRQKSRMPSSA